MDKTYWVAEYRYENELERCVQLFHSIKEINDFAENDYYHDIRVFEITGVKELVKQKKTIEVETY